MLRYTIYSPNIPLSAIWLALLLILLGAGQCASANDSVKLTVKGKLRESLCQIDGPADMIVTWPDIYTWEQLQTSSTVEFEVKLTKCRPEQMALTRLRIKANLVPGFTYLIPLDSASTAKGLALGFNVGGANGSQSGVDINATQISPVGDRFILRPYITASKVNSDIGPMKPGDFQFSATLEVLHR
ncbi:fimbrial protein [Aeromonas veronii]|uniref:fimbrial protein n=1 Tax=Aeromonas veronii TaxID=654 RepID=UPI003D245315